uniref:Uncharacterized protein n=1 Tax=Rhizophora mucronata TaxID=61149 RepID=A0A2P2Q028_RHIMU
MKALHKMYRLGCTRLSTPESNSTDLG